MTMFWLLGCLIAALFVGFVAGRQWERDTALIKSIGISEK